MGNPSDGFHGKTVSLLLGNYFASVRLESSDRLVLTANPRHDPFEFDGISAFAAHSRLNGYYGGLRILQAATKKFADLCVEAKVPV